MNIQKNISLKKYNTFKIWAIAKYFCEIKNQNEIVKLINNDVYQNNKKYFLGSGANTIFVNDFDGLVIKNNILWKEIIKNTGSSKTVSNLPESNTVQIKVWAGESWTDFVTRCAENNLVWVENLAYIPSSVWATAVQNIWAYGVEAKDVILSVAWVNLDTKQTMILSHQECDFWYRDSVFKNKLKNKFIITHVIFELQKINNDYKFNCEYGWISDKISELWLDNCKMTPLQFVEVITEIRKSKLPDWEQTWTAWSFFKNPVITVNKRKTLHGNFPELKWWEVDNGIKLSAWQLIDMCGFKGQNDGKVGTYKSHALVLVNEWPATGQDVKNFANKIKDKVKNEFGVWLEPEAVFVE